MKHNADPLRKPKIVKRAAQNRDAADSADSTGAVADAEIFAAIKIYLTAQRLQYFVAPVDKHAASHKLLVIHNERTVLIEVGEKSKPDGWSERQLATHVAVVRAGSVAEVRAALAKLSRQSTRGALKNTVKPSNISSEQSKRDYRRSLLRMIGDLNRKS